jgi:hypothetical protein
LLARRSQSLLRSFIKCLMTRSEVIFCFSLHFSQPVCSASGSVSVTKELIN